MRFYTILGVLLGPFRVGLFYVYNHFFHVPRARILVWNEDGELLLVRNWGGKQQWGLPGGGVKHHEKLVAAAKRELYEEVGLSVSVDELAYVTTVQYQYEAPIFTVDIRRHDLPKQRHNPREITDLRWFSVDSLPTDLSPLVALALKNLSKAD